MDGGQIMSKCGDILRGRIYDLYARIKSLRNQGEVALEYIRKSLDIKKVLGDRNAEYYLS